MSAHELPPLAYALHPSNKGVVCIYRGRAGYVQIDSDSPPAILNARLLPPVTYAEAEAMLAGSMFGWDVPAADPTRYRLPRSKVATIAMTTGGERRHPKVICDGRVKQWVGFGWVDEGQPSAADRAALPEVEDMA